MIVYIKNKIKKLMTSFAHKEVNKSVFKIIDASDDGTKIKLQLVNTSHVFDATPFEILTELRGGLSYQDTLFVMEHKLRKDIIEDHQNLYISEIDIDEDDIFYYLSDQFASTEYIVKHCDMISRGFLSKLTNDSLHIFIDFESKSNLKRKNLKIKQHLISHNPEHLYLV